MEEAAPAGCDRLLQLARRGDRHHTRDRHRHSRVAVGTRGSKTERHPFDASGDGMRVKRPDLDGVVHPHENPTEPRKSHARIPPADRGCSRSYRHTDSTPRRMDRDRSVPKPAGPDSVDPPTRQSNAARSGKMKTKVFFGGCGAVIRAAGGRWQ